MPENQTPSVWFTMSPSRKSALATTVMTLFLVLFTFGGYWYGKNAETTVTKTETDTNTATLTNTATADATNQVTLSGKLVTISDTALEIKITGSETDTTQQVTLDAKTAYRKLDFRSIPKNGVGDGVKITKAELKATNEIVVVTTKDGATSKAEKVYLVLYP